MSFLLKNFLCRYKKCDREAYVLSVRHEHSGSGFEIETYIKPPRKYIDRTWVQVSILIISERQMMIQMLFIIFFVLFCVSPMSSSKQVLLLCQEEK